MFGQLQKTNASKMKLQKE